MTCADISDFYSQNKFRLFLTAAVVSGFSLFITGVVCLSRGRPIPPGDIYNCSSTDFSVISQNRDPDEFYQQLQSCAFLAQCAVNITLMVCQRQCTHFFVSEAVANDVIVRTCSANRDLGFGMMAAVWGAWLSSLFSRISYVVRRIFSQVLVSVWVHLKAHFFPQICLYRSSRTTSAMHRLVLSSVRSAIIPFSIPS